MYIIIRRCEECNMSRPMSAIEHLLSQGGEMPEFSLEICAFSALSQTELNAQEQNAESKSNAQEPGTDTEPDAMKKIDEKISLFNGIIWSDRFLQKFQSLLHDQKLPPLAPTKKQKKSNTLCKLKT